MLLQPHQCRFHQRYRTNGGRSNTFCHKNLSITAKIQINPNFKKRLKNQYPAFIKKRKLVEVRKFPTHFSMISGKLLAIELILTAKFVKLGYLSIKSKIKPNFLQIQTVFSKSNKFSKMQNSRIRTTRQELRNIINVCAIFQLCKPLFSSKITSFHYGMFYVISHMGQHNRQVFTFCFRFH